jgi:hypothetical protein
MFNAIELLGHLSSALYTIGSAFRNILYLRWVFILAAITEIIYNFTIAEKPLWTPISWDVALIIINIYQILRVVYQKKFLNFSEDELQAFILIGDKMDVLNFKKLIRTGAWENYQEHKNIITENENAEKIFLLVDGEADVRISDKKISTIKKGNFIGEMSFLTGNLPSADVVASGHAKVIGWKKEKLKNLMKKDHILRHEIHSLFSHDIIAKLHTQNRQRE